MEITSVCICGAGTMGSGIAQLSAIAGLPTILYDPATGMLEKSRSSIEKNLGYLVEKNKLSTEVKEQVLKNIYFTGDIRECKSEIIIEAIVENADAKISLFSQLAEINLHTTIFATNTSSLSVTEIGNSVPNPANVIGMHFFNPAHIMKLVEVVKSEKTSGQTVQIITELAKKFGKTPVVCTDSPGFIVNRVARPFYIESLRLVELGESDIFSIDRLLEATGFKMGPFRLMDLIGNDINYAVSKSIYEQLLRPERIKPSDIQKEKVERGELGKKTGKGYYEYNK
jgi:3-hydroxybutyryl-CoA dehydrogenase